ncbi:hypothetical protein BP5796_04368 [Coleophoma crateriformis]|uniref:Transcription factor domain-containing protein n=1 Tax=Coleophoma crateriformis TaxID=565419 RepID=A0A3D8S944_9HELO|nr:hypothetical protein BP5796_04368 [Coleophoma crateriformis]
MTLQMLQPFWGQNLDEGLARYIEDVDSHGPESCCALTGPFGLFSLNAPSTQGEDSESGGKAVASLDIPLLEWVMRATSTFEEYVSIPGHRSESLNSTNLVTIFHNERDFETSLADSQLQRSSTQLRPLDASYELQFLLDHFNSHLIHLLYPMPQKQSPWRKFLFFNASQILACSNATNRASAKSKPLLYGILAMSSFHADMVYNGHQSMDEILRAAPLSSYSWNSCGARYAKLARSEIQLSFQTSATDTSFGPLPLEIVMVFLSFLAVEMITGSEYCRDLYPMICQYLKICNVHSSVTSDEASVLSCMVVYHQVVAASTVFLPLHDLGTLPSSDFQQLISLSAIIGWISEEYTGCHFESIAWPGQKTLNHEQQHLFHELYGFPYNLLLQISETTLLGNDIDKFAKLNPELALPRGYQSRADTLEAGILAGKMILPSRTRGVESSEALKHAITATISNALVIYFFRRVRRTNPAILQHYVELVLACIVEQHAIKDQYEIDAGVLMWPIFIAGCEAIEEQNQKTALSCLRQLRGCGFRIAETAEKVITELWRRRDFCSGRDLELQCILQDLGLRLQLF